MKYRLINLIMVLSMLIGSLCLILLENVTMGRFLTYLGLIIVIGLPFIFYKTMFMISQKQLFLYYVFVFLADYLGCVCRFYDYIIWYDVVIHFLSGVLSVKLGLFVLEKFGVGKNYIFNIIFSLITVMAIAGAWEIFEYACDFIFCLDMQKSIFTGVRDTMQDMIAGLMGGILYIEAMILKIKDVDV